MGRGEKELKARLSARAEAEESGNGEVATGGRTGEGWISCWRWVAARIRWWRLLVGTTNWAEIRWGGTMHVKE